MFESLSSSSESSISPLTPSRKLLSPTPRSPSSFDILPGRENNNNTIKQITDTLTVSQKHAFKKVVYIEYPKTDIWTIALVTGESIDKNKIKYYQVFVPTTPNPTSGFLLMVPKKNLIFLDISFEQASKFIVSAGTSDID